jgi:hypothetical protein
MGAHERALRQLGEQRQDVLPGRVRCELVTRLHLEAAAAGEPGDCLQAPCVRARHDPVDRVCGERGGKSPRIRSSYSIELAGTILDG